MSRLPLKRILKWLLAIVFLVAFFWNSKREDVIELGTYALIVLGSLLLIIIDAAAAGFEEIRKLRKAVFSGQQGAELNLGNRLAPNEEGLYWLRRAAELGEIAAMESLCAFAIQLSFKEKRRAIALEGIFWSLVLKRLRAGSDDRNRSGTSYGEQALEHFRGRLTPGDLAALEDHAKKAVAESRITLPRWIVDYPDVRF
jgi:hypothetical protein